MDEGKYLNTDDKRMVLLMAFVDLPAYLSSNFAGHIPERQLQHQ